MPVRVPPPEIGVVSWLTPNKTDQGLLEFWNTEIASYTPLDIGAAHPNSRQYPNFKLGKQTPVQGDEKWTLRIWVTDETNPDWFNWAGKFAGEDNAFPIFIRTYREPRLTYTPRTKGEPLKTLYKLVLTENGSGYTNGVFPNVVFDAPLVAPTEDAIAHGVVAPDGTISEAVLTFGGEGYEQDVAFRVDAPINGSPAEGIAYVQPQTVILTREEASLYPEDSPFYAQYLQVARVYETIPGPPFTETSLDIDGETLTTTTTRYLCADITTGEAIQTGVWCKSTKKPTDIDVICEWVVVCRTLPGNDMVSTKIDEDGMVLTTTRTYIDKSTGVSEETIVSGVWTRKFIEDVEGTDLVAWQVIVERDVPGNPIPSTKLDKDGKELETVRTLKDLTTIVTEETVVASVWARTTMDQVTDLVAWEIVEAREMPGDNVTSASIDGDNEVVNITTRLRPASSIIPSSTESGGFISNVEQKEITKLVSEEVRTVTRWLDKAVYRVEIPESIIPIEFRASIPTVTESHIFAGTASMPVLVGDDFMRQESQLTKHLMERRVQSLGGIEFPIETIGHVTSSEYGGAILDVVRTLNDSELFAEEGEDIVSSEVKPIGDNLMWFRETSKRPTTDALWPELTSSLWDENYRVEYTETRQVLDATTVTPAPDPGGVFAWVSEVKAIDKWRSMLINTSKPEPDYVDEASALIFYEMKPFAFPGYVVFSGYGYYQKGATAKLIQHTIRTWWVKSATTPTSGPTGSGADVEFDPIVTDTVVINNLANTGITYAENVLHDQLNFGVLDFPPTTPSATEYRFGTVTGSTILNLVGIYAPGIDYLLGNELDISGDGGAATLTVTALGVSGSVLQYTPLSGSFGWTPVGNYGPYAATGGDGTGAEFYVQAVEVPTYDDSTKWIGNEHVVGASVVAEKEKDIWKITTESVTMQ